MPDPAAPIIQNIKDANPVSAVAGAASSAIDKVKGEVESIPMPAFLSPKPPKPMPQVNAEYQQHLEQQTNIERGRAFYDAHPELFAQKPKAEPSAADYEQTAEMGKKAGASEGEEPVTPAATAGAEQAADIAMAPGENAIKPEMTAMGYPRLGGTIASAIDLYMWPPRAAGMIARKMGMSEDHANMLTNAVGGAHIAAGLYGALRAGKAGAEAIGGAIKANPVSELGTGTEGAAPEGTPLAAGPGQAEPEPRKVTPETMYTTGTETPGKPVTPTERTNFSPEQEKEFVNDTLSNFEPQGKPGLEVTKDPNALDAYHVVYRGPDGKPVSGAVVWDGEKVGQPGQLVTTKLATDKSKGLLASRATAAVGQKLQELGAAQPGEGAEVTAGTEKLMAGAAERGSTAAGEGEPKQPPFRTVERPTDADIAQVDGVRGTTTGPSSSMQFDNPKDAQRAWVLAREQKGAIGAESVTNKDGTYTVTIWGEHPNQLLLEHGGKPEAAAAGEGEPTPAQAAPTNAAPATEAQEGPKGEEQQPPRGATEIPHTVPEAVAEAIRTPLSKEEMVALKGGLSGVEEGHEMPANPYDGVQQTRVYRNATDQTAKIIETARQHGLDSPEVLEEMKHMVENVRPVVRGSWHAAGYGLRMTNVPQREDVPLLRDVMEAIENSNGGYDQMVKAICSLPTAEQSMKFTRTITQAALSKDPGVIGNIADGLANYYTHALLSVNTVAKKAATDGFMMTFGIGQSYVAEGLGRGAAALGSQNTIAPGRATAGAMGFIGAAQDAFQTGWKAMKDNVSSLDPKIWGPAGFHDASEGTLSGVNVPVLGHALSWYGKVIDLPARGILGVDNFAKVMQQRRMLHEFAWQKAYDDATSAGLQGEDFAKAVQDEYGKQIAKPDGDIMARSIQEARRQTMTAPLSDYGLSALGKMADGIRSNPLGQMLIPFFNTPVNLAMQGTEFAGPLGLASKVMRDQLLSDTPERFTALAKLGMTSLFWGAVWDHLHGPSPDNPAIKKLSEGAQGEQHQPYSLTIGNHEVGNLLAPGDNALSYMAEAKEILGRLAPGSKDADGVATAVALAFARQLDTSSSMQNLSGLVNMLSTGAKMAQSNEVAEQRASLEAPGEEEEQTPPSGIREVASAEGRRQLMKYVGSMIPSTVADLAHGIDPIHREVKSYLDEVKSRIPAFSQGIDALGIKPLKPDVDLFGRDVATPLGWNRLTGNLISLLRTTKPNADPVTDWLKKLNPTVPAIGRGGTLPVGEHGRVIKVPASDEQIYMAQKLLGSIQDPSTGLTLHETLDQMRQDKSFTKMPVDVQLRKVTRMITGFTHGAIQQVVGMNPDIQRSYNTAAAQKNQQMGVQ